MKDTIIRTGAITGGFLITVAISFSLGWFIQGYTMYKNLLVGYGDMMPPAVIKSVTGVGHDTESK